MEKCHTNVVQLKTKRHTVMWCPYILCSVSCLVRKSKNFIFLESNSVSLLPRIVDKYRRNLVEPLKNSPRSVSNRAIIEKGLKEPIDTDEGPKLLTQSLIDETLIISEIYNLDEIKTLELLWAAENHLPQYPGLTRGLGKVIF